MKARHDGIGRSRARNRRGGGRRHRRVAVKDASASKFRNAGQVVCILPTPLPGAQAHSVADVRSAGALAKHAKGLKGGRNGLEEGARDGPARNPARLAAMEELTRDCLRKWRHLARGGERNRRTRATYGQNHGVRSVPLEART